MNNGKAAPMADRKLEVQRQIKISGCLYPEDD
jgi:hypothetical protein